MTTIAQKTLNLFEKLNEPSQQSAYDYIAYLHDKNTTCVTTPDPAKVPRIGIWDGLVEIPDDFNDPLPEMLEYM